MGQNPGKAEEKGQDGELGSLTSQLIIVTFGYVITLIQLYENARVEKQIQHRFLPYYLEDAGP